MLGTLLNKIDKVELPPKKAMVELTSFNSGTLPHRELQQFTQEVNSLINKYNRTIPDSERKKILHEIQQKMQQIDYKYKPSELAGSPGYQAASASLFLNIKYQYASMGIFSLITNPLHSSPLSELIANMSPAKINKLLGILLKGANKNLATELCTIYESANESLEAWTFHKFLQHHEISYLGGKNSKNFKVRCININSEQVLKVDCRLDMPRNVEAHLRQKLGDRFAPIYTERQATCLDDKGVTLSRTIQVTDFYKEGNILDYRNSLATTKEQIDNTAKIFAQMAHILLDIEAAGCMFPDAKITNWLVSGGQLHLADTKSFVFTDEQGQYPAETPTRKNYRAVRTHIFNPPEFCFSKSENLACPQHSFFSQSDFCSSKVDADAVHAYILGKNLYVYATGRFEIGYSSIYFDFGTAFFQTTSGQLYRELIEGLVKATPAERLTVKDAADRLSIMNDAECNTAFIELKRMKFGKNDKKMHEFIHEKRQQIIQAQPDERKILLQKLQGTINALKKDKATAEIRKIIHDYRTKVRLLTIGMHAKANRLEQAMADVPIVDRCNFLASTKRTEVMFALASPRYRPQRRKDHLTEQMAMEKTKSSAFKNFNLKFLDSMTRVKSPNSEVNVLTRVNKY